MRKLIVVILILLTLGFGACAYYFYFDTYHFAIVQPGVLYRDGFQGMRRFENAYRQRPFKCVVNLQSDADLVQYKDDIAAEQAFCKERGIKWIHLPMKQKTAPTTEQMSDFVAIVKDAANQPVLAHDSQGVVREGMMVAVWQKDGMGYDFEKCVSEVKWFGHEHYTELLEFIRKLYNKN
ncbi:MAG TPA: hypothetical protein VKX17_00640 [Planctomycetota bacterium]|nr:hypothetical protein [Planctomycetota bacterium]